MKLCLSAAAAFAVALLLSGTALAQGHRHTISLYERDASPSRLAVQGCSAARRGESGIVVLDFGKPAYYGHRYGTIDFSDRFVSNPEITTGMLGWAKGYVRCLSGSSDAVVTLARGTSNYSPAVPSAFVAGARWARSVRSLEGKLWRHGLHRHVRSAGADDAEPAWDRAFLQTKSFIKGFRQFSNGRTLYDYGSLDGGVGSIWSARQMMYVTGGKAVLPEIYYASQAQEWAEFAYIAHRVLHRSVHFAGVMTQGSPSCGCGYRPLAAHRALVRELAKVDTGRRTRVPRVGTTIVSG